MRGETPMLNTDARRAISTDQSEQEHLRPLAALMVHVDMDHDSEQTVELAIALAERFQAALIGVAGCALWPAFMAGDVQLTNANQYDFQKVMARFEQSGGILLRAGRPVLLVPDTAHSLGLRRVVVAWKDTRECRRAVRDALPLLQEAKEVLLVAIGEHESHSQGKKTLADVGAYLVRHRVIVADEMWQQPRGPVAAELFQIVEEEKADLEQIPLGLNRRDSQALVNERVCPP
jgi:hypothetical protein